jgi:hypothetical protein
MKPISDIEASGIELWRRQHTRNMMDCYALGMEVLSSWPGHRTVESLVRLMVDALAAARGAKDEKAFYKTAAGLCRECAKVGGEKAGMFRIYGAIFEDMAREEGES